ncbi:MAG: nucleoside-diphosphate sugar epimerase/dehydratase [Fulvivirga sp.]|uniref:polysaccharide biosynthesis protein n=1 Tax=Fulvivirga sp. TaxID=1931237 RepID=UPI0032EE6644
MITKFLLRLRILPRWVIIVLDVGVILFATFLGYCLRFNFDLSLIDSYNPLEGIILNGIAGLISLLITRSYAGIVRYTGLKDGLRVFQTLILTHALSSLVNLVYHYNVGSNLIPYSVILISFLASFLFLFQYRLLIKNIFSYYGRLYHNKINVAIFGAGQMGIMTKHLLDDDHKSGMNVVAFFEDDTNKIGKIIAGTEIYSLNEIELFHSKYQIEELIIAVNQLSVQRKNEIVDTCLNYNLKVRTVPNLNTWVKGELSLNQIKEVKIEDLLERDSITIKNEELVNEFSGKVVCISGAAGSIGSELVRQVIELKPKSLLLIDQSETPLYNIINELDNQSEISIDYYVADITNSKRIESLFIEHQPQIVFHAAAYKHVPLMEANPSEAILCNVIGTYNLANAADKFGVEKFVMVSTDKAVNPTNVMGASKRIAEMYVQSLNNQSKTSFITTRFGNVLGSNGSVIPHFKNQIEKGGPVTVTHPEINRYFMTISEACELILEAGCMGKGGEIFIFDMGKSVRIVDLARKMIKLSGFEPYKDIDIVFTGLRQGEKLFEELLTKGEDNLPTHHPKILIAKINVPDYIMVNSFVERLRTMLESSESELSLVSLMKEIVPEFKSNRSIYEILDR